MVYQSQFIVPNVDGINLPLEWDFADPNVLGSFFVKPQRRIAEFHRSSQHELYNNYQFECMIAAHLSHSPHQPSNPVMSNLSRLQSSWRFRQIYLILDWDGTITGRDTMAVLAGICYKKRETLHVQDRQPAIIPPWNHFVQAYLAEYDRHLASYKPVKGDRRSVTEESAWLASLKTIEEASFDRVNRAGLFQGVTNNDLNNGTKLAIQEKRVELRPGWEELLTTTASKYCFEVRIASVNWSSSFIRASISAALELKTEELGKQPADTDGGILSAAAVHANEVIGIDSANGGPKSSMMTGSIKLLSANSCSGFHVAADKAQLLKELRTTLSGASQPMSLDAYENSLLIYVGDSATDFDCLVEADVGICIQDEPLSSSQSELEDMFARVGFVSIKLSKFGPMTFSLSTSEAREKVIWIAQDLREVSNLVKELSVHGRPPKRS